MVASRSWCAQCASLMPCRTPTHLGGDGGSLGPLCFFSVEVPLQPKAGFKNVYDHNQILKSNTLKPWIAPF